MNLVVLGFHKTDNIGRYEDHAAYNSPVLRSLNYQFQVQRGGFYDFRAAARGIA